MPSMITSYNAKPVLIRRTGSIFRGNNYLEMNIHVHKFATMAKQSIYQISSRCGVMFMQIGRKLVALILWCICCWCYVVVIVVGIDIDVYVVYVEVVVIVVNAIVVGGGGGVVVKVSGDDDVSDIDLYVVVDIDIVTTLKLIRYSSMYLNEILRIWSYPYKCFILFVIYLPHIIDYDAYNFIVF